MYKKAKKFWQLIFGGLRYDPRALLHFCWHILVPTKPTPAQELSTQTIIKAIASGTSFIRLGDGEALILTGRDIYFQPVTKALALGLQTIVANYTPASPYILGVPTNKLSLTEEELGSAKQRRLWRLYRVLFPLRFPLHTAYAPLTFFYVGGRFQEHITPLLRDKHVIFLSNEDVLDQALQDYAQAHFAHYTFITTPARDAFQQQAATRTAIDRAIKGSNLSPVLLCAAGPASKVLAYEYTMQGIQCLDIGHGMPLIAHDQDRSYKI